MWKKVSSREVFNHPRLSLIEDEVILPSGKQTSYLRYKDDGKGGASVIAQREDGKILVQKEYAYPVGEMVYQFPGGGVMAGEDFAVAANRELMEESGYKAGKLSELGWYLPNYRRSAARVYVFLGTGLTEEKLPGDVEEVIETHWMTEGEIDKLIISGEINNSLTLSAWSLYKARKSGKRI